MKRSKPRRPELAPSERQLQTKILKLIRAEKLGENIDVPAALTSLAEERGENSFASFAIDHNVRISCARAASQALDCLALLEVLTDDLNVSATANEILRPDIVCYNPEKETLVIFELKKSGQTGRQALTELLAYEQELKNILPFLSNYDTVFVLISTEWTTLMDHSAASAVAWSGKTLLCLEATVGKQKLSLKPRLPEAWFITGSRYFPPDSLPTVTVCLYDYSTFEDGDAKVPKLDTRLFTVLDLIAREGDRIGGHGFLVVWRDHSSFSLAPFNITVCGVSPFAFYKAMRERGNVAEGDGHLVTALDKMIVEQDPNGHSQSMFKAIEAGMAVLKEFSSPHYEGFHTWAIDRQILRGRSTPIWCDFWGLPGIFAREFVASPGVRKHKSQWLRSSDWRDPRIGINILNGLLEPAAFGDGNVRCSDCFKFGLALGRDLTLRQVLAAVEDEKAKERVGAHLTWGFYELSALVEEVRLLADAATNVEAPDKPLALNGDPASEDASYVKPLIEWFARDFIQGGVFHSMFFEIGLNSALVFDHAVGDMFSDEDLKNEGARLEPLLLKIYKLVLGGLAYSEKDGGLLDAWKEAKRILFRLLRFPVNLSSAKAIQRISEKSAEELISAWPRLLELADSHIPPVFHIHGELAPSDIDWDWLKQGIREMRKRGVEFPAVHLQANGTIATGPVGQQGMSAIGDVSDTEEGVLFCDHSSTILVVKKTTWATLRAGEHFPVASAKTGGHTPD